MPQESGRQKRNQYKRLYSQVKEGAAAGSLCVPPCGEPDHLGLRSTPKSPDLRVLATPPSAHSTQQTAPCAKAIAEGHTPPQLACREFPFSIARGEQELPPDASSLGATPETSCRACCSTCARATSANRDGFLRNRSVWSEQKNKRARRTIQSVRGGGRQTKGWMLPCSARGTGSTAYTAVPSRELHRPLTTSVRREILRMRGLGSPHYSRGIS